MYTNVTKYRWSNQKWTIQKKTDSIGDITRRPTKQKHDTVCAWTPLSASKHNKHMIEHFQKTEGGMSSSSILFLFNTFLPIFFNKLLKTCTRFTTTIKIMHVHTMLHVISFNIHIETLLSKLSISNMTRVQSLKKIIEWEIISKCLFGADFAKC